MQSKRIYSGNIYEVTDLQLQEEAYGLSVIKKEIEVSKENRNVILVKLKENEYVRIEDFNRLFYFRKLFPELFQSKIINPFDPIKMEIGYTFIREEELHPYISKTTDIDLKIVKKRHARY